MFGLKPDCLLEVPEKYYTFNDYEGALARWCPGCGCHAILTSIQKVCQQRQLPPEKTVFVSGIGCSSRFPHYMKTYGFHGLHGRALPVACGIKFRRPDLSVFVCTGDGDCCSIGTAHWIHAIRYNMDLTVLMFDNEIYGLTKKQTSPTSRKGTRSNTHPRGSVLPALDPIQTTLGVGNVSFVAQTVDWNPAHMYATFLAAAEHPGFSFVRILERCAVYKKELFEPAVLDPDLVSLITHENGIQLDANAARSYKNVIEHDPSDLNQARKLVEDIDGIPIGLFYQNKDCERYDLFGAANLNTGSETRLAAIEKELNRYAV